MAKNTKQSEKRKKIILAALLLGLAVVMVINFMGGSRSTPTQQQAQNQRQPLTPGQRTPGQQSRRPATDDERLAMINQMLADTSALNLRLVSHGGGAGEDFGKHRNIFAYKPPPIIPPPPPKPPPPITINPPQVEGSIVAGSPFKVPVHVTGTNFPPDATIYFDGRPKPTTGQGTARLTTQLEPGEYTSPRSIQVDVKSQSDPVKFYSNVMGINIADLPAPQIIYHGRHGTSFAAVENPSTRRSELVKRGDTIQGWRVDAITESSVELFHPRYEIRRRIPLKNKTP